jgi:hypothetical protein
MNIREGIPLEQRELRGHINTKFKKINDTIKSGII